MKNKGFMNEGGRVNCGKCLPLLKLYVVNSQWYLSKYVQQQYRTQKFGLETCWKHFGEGINYGSHNQDQGIGLGMDSNEVNTRKRNAILANSCRYRKSLQGFLFRRHSDVGVTQGRIRWRCEPLKKPEGPTAVCLKCRCSYSPKKRKTC